MEPKKRVVIRLKKTPEPPKVKKVSKKFQELLDQGLRYYRFVQDIAIMDRWCKFVIATGKKPNDRLRELVKRDTEKYEKDEYLKHCDLEKMGEWYKNPSVETSGSYTQKA